VIVVKHNFVDFQEATGGYRLVAIEVPRRASSARTSLAAGYGMKVR